MEWDFIGRLCVAGLCGTVIGLDREYRVKDAGFRTHFLVALGSALMMVVSQYGFEEFLASHDCTVKDTQYAADVRVCVAVKSAAADAFLADAGNFMAGRLAAEAGEEYLFPFPVKESGE